MSYLNNRNKIILIVVLILGFILRISIINFGLPSKNLALTTYNPDEPLSYYTIEQWNPAKFDFHPHRAFLWGGFHLFPLAASLGVAKILGFIKLGNRKFYVKNLNYADRLYLVGRFLMILCAVCSTFFIFLICKESYGETVGLLSAFLLSITPAHIFNSIYVRPDIMMMFLGLVSLYFSVKLLKTGDTRFYLLSCLFVGFSTGTKISGAIFAIPVLTAHFLHGHYQTEKNKGLNFSIGKFKDFRLYLIPLLCLLSFCISSPYVVLDFNKSPESFMSYFKANITLAKGSMDPGQFIMFGSGLLSYFKHYLKYGLGIAVVIMAITGIFAMLINVFRKRNKFDILFLFSGLIVFFTISYTKSQAVWYIFPVVPFFIIYVVRGFDIIFNSKNKVLSSITVIILIFVFSYTFIYSIAHITLYRDKNVREEASEWIEKNIAKDKKIAVARSYFWTPAILRQYNPPYKLLMGADPVNSTVSEGVGGLKNISFKADYIVLSEFEYRQFIHPKLHRYFPEQAEILDLIMLNEKKFKKVANFTKNAKFLWFKFKKDYVPGDWLIPNPDILIFKKV